MIKVTQAEAMGAFTALMEMRGRKMGFQTALSIVKLHKALETNARFQIEEEEKIFREFGKEKGPDGGVDFGEDKEARTKCLEKLQELAKMEVEIEAKPINLQAEENNPDFKISPEELAALEKFIQA